MFQVKVLASDKGIIKTEDLGTGWKAGVANMNFTIGNEAVAEQGIENT